MKDKYVINSFSVTALGDEDGFTIEMQNVAADSDICPSYREPATTYIRCWRSVSYWHAAGLVGGGTVCP